MFSEMWLDFSFALMLLVTAVYLGRCLRLLVIEYAIDSAVEAMIPSNDKPTLQRRGLFWLKVITDIVVLGLLIIGFGGLGIYKLGDMLAFVITGR